MREEEGEGEGAGGGGGQQAGVRHASCAHDGEQLVQERRGSLIFSCAIAV